VPGSATVACREFGAEPLLIYLLDGRESAIVAGMDEARFDGRVAVITCAGGNPSLGRS
jgi:hypothetical protein